MTPELYQDFTRRLSEGLERDERVLGLVALGSMAAQDYIPDRWSDHDFFVIVGSGEQEGFRLDSSWLPDHDEIVLWFRETEHGVKALYRSGHLLEFAVFDVEELRLARINRYRVLIDRASVADALATLRADTVRWTEAGRRDDEHLVGQFLSNLFVGAGRCSRGELLSGTQFVKGYALTHLVTLLQRHVPAADRSLLDDLDPLRRFERVYPELGAEIAACLSSAPLAAGAGLLALAEREIAPRVARWPAEAARVVAGYLGE